MWKTFLAKNAHRVAPNLAANLRTLRAMDEQLAEGPSRFVNYERELRALRREIDELRRDNRRVAELYDVVFERAKQDAAAARSARTGEPGPGAPADAPADVTVADVAADVAADVTVADATAATDERLGNALARGRDH